MPDEGGYNEAILVWLADALVWAYSQGQMVLMMYLEAVLEEVLLEVKLSSE